MKKYLKLVILLIIVLIVFLIYTIFKTDKIKYVSLGDTISSGINPYNKIEYGYTDYLKDMLKISSYSSYGKSQNKIEDILNNLNNNLELKKDLRESDLVTISIGLNDFLENNDIDVNKLLDNKEKIDEIISKIDNLILEIKKYAKNKIVIVGYYNPIPFLNNINSNIDTLFAYIDFKYMDLSKKHEIIYIPTYEVFKNNKFLPNPNSIYPNSNGYKQIAKLILAKIE